MKTTTSIVDLTATDAGVVDSVAEVLFESFRDLSPRWLPTMRDARDEVAESFEEGRLSRVLLLDDGSVGGWVGARHSYGYVWELHPMVVAQGHRGKGFGRSLVRDVGRLVAARGALTLQLGTSDEADLTTLFGVDLYADPLGAMRELRATDAHPLGFWLRVGFTVVGVVPDAEGMGMPTIQLARRVGGLL